MSLLVPAGVNVYPWGTPVTLMSGDPRWQPGAAGIEFSPPFLAIPPPPGEPYPADPEVVTLSVRPQGQPTQKFVYGSSAMTKILSWGPSLMYSEGLYSFVFDTSTLASPPQSGLFVFYQWSGSGVVAAINKSPVPYFVLMPPELPITVSVGSQPAVREASDSMLVRNAPLR